MLDVGSQKVMMPVLYDYRVEIACLNDVRIPGSGSKHLKIPGEDCVYWFYHSDHVDSSGHHEVALSSTANNAVTRQTPISPRIAMARFRSRPLHTTVTAVHAPTLLTEVRITDKFYEQLRNVVNQIPDMTS